MGDILEFPSQQAQGLAFLDQRLRAMLEARGADEQLIDFAASQLTRIYADLSESEQYSFSVQIPASINPTERERLQQQINEGLQGIRSENHSLLIKMVAELVLARVRLFQHERPD